MEPRISDADPLEESFASMALNETQQNARVRAKLEKLEGRRVDASQLKFGTNGPRVEGGFAVVCRASLMVNSPNSTGAAVDEQKDVDVAVKMMKIKEGDSIHQVLRRAVREADLLAGLNHENIIKLEGFVEDLTSEIIWLVFLWAEMGNIRDFVASKDWSIPERIWLIDDVARGVEHLHSREPPICHGDLKSINILVNSKCRAIITDFGSARRVMSVHDAEEHEPRPAQRLTTDETTLSVEFCQSSNTVTFTGTKYTLRWAAPEVLVQEDAGTAADIWSMGWVFYEIMTGSIPFENVQKDATIIQRIVKGDFPSLKDHNRMSPILSLVSIMMKCWEITPERRPSAETCRKYVSRMPMCAPRSKQSPSTALEAAGRLFNEGVMYKLQNDYDRALAAFNSALKELGDQASSTTEGADILWGIAEIHRLRNEYDEAAAQYSEVVRISEETGNRSGKVEAQVGLAEVHRARDEYDKAAALYAEVVQFHEEIGDRIGKAHAQHGLATVHRLRNEYDEAAALYSEVIQICEEIGDRRGKAGAQFGLAEVHRLRNEYDEASALYTEIVQIREETGDRLGKADAQWGLAEVHVTRAEYDEAAVLYAEVAQICEEIGDRGGKADGQLGLAEIHRLRGEFEEAATLYAELVQIHEEVGNRRGKANAKSGLAEVHHARVEYDKAAALYAEVIQISEEIGDRSGKASAKRGLASIHRARKEYAESLQLFMESSQLCRAYGLQLGLAYSLRGSADVYNDQARFKDATKYYEEAAEVFRAVGYAETASNLMEHATEARRKDTELAERDE